MKNICTVLTIICALGRPAATAAEGPDLSQASMDALIVHYQQYGNTPARRQMRNAASKEIIARGTNAFHYLMDRFHIDNMANRMMADQMVRKHLDDDVAADALLRYIDHPMDLTRKSAAYYLAFCNTPQHAQKLIPLLDDEKAAGAAMRTLGKWSYTNAVPGILPHLNDDDERRRILAVNALGELREPSTVESLLSMLEDPLFTVRKAAVEALIGFGSSADAVIADALMGLKPVSQREVVALLAERDQVSATNRLIELQGMTLTDSMKADVSSAIKTLQRPED